jgi:hypothetical protein
MPAQKTALVCLTILILLLAHDAMRFFARTSTTLAFGKDEIALRVCLRPPSSEQPGNTCALLLRVHEVR